MNIWVARQMPMTLGGGYIILHYGELFCQVSDKDLSTFKDLCENSGHPLKIELI